MQGLFFTSQKAFIVETPIRIPVKEPGPLSQTNKSISSIEKFVLLKICSIIGIKQTECVLYSLLDKLAMTFSSFKIATQQLSDAVSIARIFIIYFSLIFYYCKYSNIFIQIIFFKSDFNIIRWQNIFNNFSPFYNTNSIFKIVRTTNCIKFIGRM